LKDSFISNPFIVQETKTVVNFKEGLEGVTDIYVVAQFYVWFELFSPFVLGYGNV